MKFPRFKWDPTNYRTIYGIVNDNHHWFAVIIYPKQGKSLLLDSLGVSSLKLKTCKDISRALLRKQGMNVSRWECNTLPHPLQPDSSSCGVFAIKFVENILTGQPLVFPAGRSDVDALRWQIAETVLEASDDLTDICCICGQEDVDEEDVDDPNDTKSIIWISCDVCGRWFHHVCSGCSDTSAAFICEAC
ncbi:unnamed protein product [Knipowitschia caucasica]